MNAINLDLIKNSSQSGTDRIEALEAADIQSLIRMEDIDSLDTNQSKKKLAQIINETLPESIFGAEDKLESVIAKLNQLGIDSSSLSDTIANARNSFSTYAAPSDNEPTGNFAELKALLSDTGFFEDTDIQEFVGNLLNYIGSTGSTDDTLFPEFQNYIKQITQTKNSSTNNSTTVSYDTFFSVTDNVLIKLMLIMVSIFSECLNSLSLRGEDLNKTKEGIKNINEHAATFAQLSTALAIAPDGVTTIEGLFNEAGKADTSGNLTNPELYNLVEPIANAMGMTITPGTTPIIKSLDSNTTLDTAGINSAAENYFKEVQSNCTNLGAGTVTLPTTSEDGNIYISKGSVDIVNKQLQTATLYAGNVSQTQMQEMKILQDFLTIYMQSATNLANTNKEANQAVYR